MTPRRASRLPPQPRCPSDPVPYRFCHGIATAFRTDGNQIGTAPCEGGGSTRAEHSTTRWGFKSGKVIDDREYPQVKHSNKCPDGDLPTWDTHLRHLAPGLVGLSPGL
jgi:hypothetical protein